MLDFLLDRETKNLIKINKIWNEINRILYHDYIKEFREELEAINTKEHKEKIEFYLLILEWLWKLHIQYMKKPK